jgi:tetratricopeptide (TPR) repeat protein
VGDDITITLNGTGWTFTGGGRTENRWKQGVRYENRTADSNGTTFLFKAKNLGEWTLDFQHQKASSGNTSEETIDIHVLTEEQFKTTIASAGIGGPSGLRTGTGAVPAARERTLSAADWLYKEGKYAQALDAYEKAWQTDNPTLTDKIAGLAYRIGRYSDARKYWQKNFDLSGTTYGALAVAGLMKTATAEKDAPELRALFGYVHALKGVQMRSDLLAAARYLFDAKDWEVAIRYLEEYLARYRGQEGSDVADYLLGRIYQGDTPMQDAQKALVYYREIVAQYPASDYYGRAKENINYLVRYFFEIR